MGVSAMDNQNMTYPELRDLFVERNKTQLAKPVSACIVFAESNWPDHQYPLCSRTYEVSSDNKAFRSSCCSTSLFGSCLDGTDQMVRLDWYMKDFGNKGGWVVDHCYLKENSVTEPPDYRGIEEEPEWQRPEEANAVCWSD